MLNTTFLSLTVLSSFAPSPFHIIDNGHERFFKTTFYNSHFSKSFSSFITCYTTKHQTKIVNSAFSFTLDSSIKFSNACYINADKPIGGITFNYDMFENSKDHRPYFTGDCGDIIMTGCIFDHCMSTIGNPGGSLFISQDSTALIHNTIFNHSHTNSNLGGAIFAVHNKVEIQDTNFQDEQMKKLDIQYCCFQHCYGDSDSGLYGVAVFSAAVENILYYASTVDCVGENRKQSQGAQFDLQAKNVTSKYVNSTGANSNFCGGIEYRHASQGFFRFQTISDMSCMFSVSYTSIVIDELSLELSNIINVTVRRGSTGDEYLHSGLIHIRYSKTIIISNFSFINYKLNRQFIQNKNGVDLYDEQKIITRGTEGGKPQEMTITLIDCYYSGSHDDVIYNDRVTIKTQNCFGDSDKINDIPQLNLGECKGEVKPRPLTPTYYFSDSFEFTFSKEFSKTFGFSETNGFSKTKMFSESGDFSKSNVFDDSSYFSSSFEFTKTSRFSDSFDFSQTKDFTETKHFSVTSDFTKSSSFSDSLLISKGFSKSNVFSQTYDFSKSNMFSQTYDFSKSIGFSTSSVFSKSIGFSSSSVFSRSNCFSDYFTSIIPIVNPDLSTNKDKSTNVGLIAGIVAGVVAAIIIVVLITIFLMKKKKSMVNEEEVETISDDKQSINSVNPIYDDKGEDDPFKEDFE